MNDGIKIQVYKLCTAFMNSHDTTRNVVPWTPVSNIQLNLNKRISVHNILEKVNISARSLKAVIQEHCHL